MSNVYKKIGVLIVVLATIALVVGVIVPGLLQTNVTVASIPLRELVTVLLLWGAFYASGSLVLYRNVKVNYTRKIVHFSFFFLPLFLDAVFPIDGAGSSASLSYIFILISFVVFIEPILSRAPFAQRMFLAIDRPEDRPYTLRWWWIQIFTAIVALSIGAVILNVLGYGEMLVLVPVLAAMGDGLAEPIGVRFGKHKYRIYTLFAKTDQKYYRTIEGSATVFVATFVVVLFSGAFFTTPEFILALILVPTIITVAEAIAPHTMDTPFLQFFGCIALVLAKHFV